MLSKPKNIRDLIKKSFQKKRPKEGWQAT